MSIFHAPQWGGTMASTNLLAGEAGQDASQGLAMTMAKLQHEMDQRSQLFAILDKMRKRRDAQKAAAKQKRGFMGLGGAGAGALVGGLLAAPTGGMSVLAGSALGAGVGGAVGGGIDQATGYAPGAGSNLGNELMDFNAAFTRMGQQDPMEDIFGSAPYPQGMKSGGGSGMSQPGVWNG